MTFEEFNKKVGELQEQAQKDSETARETYDKATANAEEVYSKAVEEPRKQLREAQVAISDRFQAAVKALFEDTQPRIITPS